MIRNIGSPDIALTRIQFVLDLLQSDLTSSGSLVGYTEYNQQQACEFGRVISSRRNVRRLKPAPSRRPSSLAIPSLQRRSGARCQDDGTCRQPDEQVICHGLLRKKVLTIGLHSSNRMNARPYSQCPRASRTLGKMRNKQKHTNTSRELTDRHRSPLLEGFTGWCWDNAVFHFYSTRTYS